MNKKLILSLLLGAMGTPLALAANVNLVHTFLVKDTANAPIEGVLITPTRFFAAKLDNPSSPTCTTNAEGRCQLAVTSQFDGRYVQPYSTVMARASKAGYLTQDFTDEQGKDNKGGGQNVVLAKVRQQIATKFTAQDLQGAPLAGVRVNTKIERYKVASECVTDQTGSCVQTLEFDATDNKALETVSSTQREGRYDKSITKDIKVGANEEAFQFVLDQPLDYLCAPLKVPASKALAGQMSTWVDTLRLRAIIQNTVVNHGDFCTTNFKNKRYASVVLAHTSTYNSLKLTSYQIGTRMFDEVVRKMLDVVAPAVATFPLDGYEIRVNTAMGDASDDYRNPKSLSYQFYLPKKAVASYKNKDLTGQQLLDASVVLLNDERIDLKLQ